MDNPDGDNAWAAVSKRRDGQPCLAFDISRSVNCLTPWTGQARRNTRISGAGKTHFYKGLDRVALVELQLPTGHGGYER